MLSNALDQCQQIIVVLTMGWDSVQGNLRMFEREGKSWVKTNISAPIVVGEKGMAWGIGLHSSLLASEPFKREGDRKSPAGIFSLGSAFGHLSADRMISLKLDYLAIDQHTEAVDDPQSFYYNQIVNTRKTRPDWKSAEKMHAISCYEIGLQIHHNFPSPIPGAGSAIFFHIWRDHHHGTAGCTAASRDIVASLLSRLDKNKNPLFVQFPVHVYQKWQKEWNLPKWE